MIIYRMSNERSLIEVLDFLDLRYYSESCKLPIKWRGFLAAVFRSWLPACGGFGVWDTKMVLDRSWLSRDGVNRGGRAHRRR